MFGRCLVFVCVFFLRSRGPPVGFSAYLADCVMSGECIAMTVSTLGIFSHYRFLPGGVRLGVVFSHFALNRGAVLAVWLEGGPFARGAPLLLFCFPFWYSGFVFVYGVSYL